MTPPLKIAIFGAGSIGCYLGGLLANGGAKVIFIGREKYKKALSEHGLKLTHYERSTIELDKSDFEFSLKASDIKSADVILVTVKSQDTEKAAAMLANFAKPDALIISFQNGINNTAILQRALPIHKVLGGVVPFNIIAQRPGHFHCATEGHLSVGSDDLRINDLAGLFLKSKQMIDVFDDILTVQWGKLLVNLNNALNALSGRPIVDGLMEHDYRKALALVIEEALSVARGYGINPAAFGKTSPDKTIKILRLPNFIYSVIVKVIIKIDATARSSMLADLESGRPSEIDYLQGEIVSLARRNGQVAPYNQKILEMIKHAFEMGVSPELSGRDIYQALKGVKK